MDTRELTQDIIERWGEESQIEMIINSSMKLGLALQDYKTKKDESQVDFIETYNQVCERIAEMKLMMEQAEFIFNKDEIQKHHDILVEHFQQKLNEY